MNDPRALSADMVVDLLCYLRISVGSGSSICELNALLGKCCGGEDGAAGRAWQMAIEGSSVRRDAGITITNYQPKECWIAS
jgi:hypothetical protein